jgi:hypothetical protein
MFPEIKLETRFVEDHIFLLGVYKISWARVDVRVHA